MNKTMNSYIKNIELMNKILKLQNDINTNNETDYDIEVDDNGGKFFISLLDGTCTCYNNNCNHIHEVIKNYAKYSITREELKNFCYKLCSHWQYYDEGWIDYDIKISTNIEKLYQRWLINSNHSVTYSIIINKDEHIFDFNKNECFCIFEKQLIRDIRRK